MGSSSALKVRILPQIQMKDKHEYSFHQFDQEFDYTSWNVITTASQYALDKHTSFICTCVCVLVKVTRVDKK